MCQGFKPQRNLPTNGNPLVLDYIEALPVRILNPHPITLFPPVFVTVRRMNEPGCSICCRLLDSFLQDPSLFNYRESPLMIDSLVTLLNTATLHIFSTTQIPRHIMALPIYTISKSCALPFTTLKYIRDRPQELVPGPDDPGLAKVSEPALQITFSREPKNPELGVTVPMTLRPYLLVLWPN